MGHTVLRGGWVRRSAYVGLTAGLLASLIACTANNSSSGSASSAASAGTSAPAPKVPAAPISVVAPVAPASSANGSASASSPNTAAPTTATAALLPAAAITASPELGSSDIAPNAPISIAVKDGTIKNLQVFNPAGKAVVGKLSADEASWTLGEDLGYGKTYTVSGTAVGENGKAVKIAGSYTTLSPDYETSAQVSPGNGDVVGVAAPIIVRFSTDPTGNRAAIQKAMKVVTSPAVKGSWAWITHDGDTYPSLDWRPEAYWPQFTKVHVEADIYGVSFSSGVYGAADVTSDFTIARNQVVIANAKKYDIVIQRAGQTVATYPASYGMGDDPNSRYGINPQLVTRSGVHIVMDKRPTVTMSNPAYGYTHSVEHWAVRMSDNGEFIHENPNTVDKQGNTNVSHGCINLSAGNAQAYFNSAIYGDPIEVTGTSVKLSPADGDIYDWAFSWPEWAALSAL